ncbi:hypothetical protein [Psychrobacter raelei]|uniref:hypothetical protein n=1 Tax=Psychrobacter raelei TaxID=2565531 RepID=UPI003F5DDA20
MDILSILWPSVYALLTTVFVLYLDHKLIPRTSKKYLHVVRWILLYLNIPVILTTAIGMLISVLIPTEYNSLAMTFAEKVSTESFIASLLSGLLLRTKGGESSGGHINLHKKRIALVIILYALFSVHLYQTRQTANEIEGFIQQYEQGQVDVL